MESQTAATFLVLGVKLMASGGAVSVHDCRANSWPFQSMYIFQKCLFCHVTVNSHTMLLLKDPVLIPLSPQLAAQYFHARLRVLCSPLLRALTSSGDLQSGGQLHSLFYFPRQGFGFSEYSWLCWNSLCRSRWPQT